MSLGFLKQPRLVIFGDGEGNVVFEEYEDNECTKLTARILIEWNRFEVLQTFCDELRSEAFHNKED